MKKKTLSLDDSIILSCAFRYALGRMTYVVSVVAQRLIDNYNRLSEVDKMRYVKEIEEAEAEHSLGMSPDKEQWMRVKHLFDPQYHYKIKAFYAAESKIEEVGKETTIEIIPDKFEIKEAVLMNGKFYDLDMKRYFHSWEMIERIDKKME